MEMNQVKEVHLLDYWNLIRKRKWILIACVFITVVTTVIGNYTIVPIYQAKCQLIIDKDMNRSPVTGENLEYLYYESAFSEEKGLNTQSKIITSYSVLEDVIRKLSLQDRKKAASLAENTGFFSNFKANIRENMQNIKEIFRNIFKSRQEEGDAVDDAASGFSGILPDKKMADMVSALRSKINVEQVVDTRLINITVTDESPVWAAIIANSLGETYIDYDRAAKQSSVKDFMDWIAEQITEMKQKVNESEKRFFDYKSESKIFSIETKQGINAQNIAELNDSFIKTNSERIEIKGRILQLENLINKSKDKSLSQEIINDPILRDLNKQLIDAQIELNDLSLRYKDKHPNVLNVKNRVSKLNEEFNKAVQKALKGLQIQDDLLRGKEEAIRAAMADIEADALETNKKEVQYSILEREVETNKTLYDILVSKLKETKINESMKKSNIRFTEPASVPASPIKPKKRLNIILGFILGSMAGIGLIFLMEYMQTEIRTEDDVRQYLKLPVLGIVPEFDRPKKAKNKRPPLVTDKESSAVFSEAFRSLRTNIGFSLDGASCKSLLITSSIPQEGKTTTVVNLGLTLAQAGLKALVMDTDLRVPSLYKSFGLERNKGLTNILTGIFNTNVNEGTLSEYGIGDIVNLISIQGRSGILSIYNQSDNFQLSFNQGELVNIQWKDRPDEKRLETLLLGTGNIDEEKLQRALKQQEHCRESLSTILLNTNLITPEQLQGPLRLHFASIINKILAIQEGCFMFNESRYYHHNLLNFDYLKDIFSSCQEIICQQNTPFLGKNISSLIMDTPAENLKALASGPLPPNPSELIGSRRMKALMSILRRRFDYILMDSPPVNSVTDASILASLVDGVIHVVYVGRANRNAAMKAKQQLDSIGARIFGVVLNRLNLKKDGYYYYSYYHYYQYGDYYKGGKGHDHKGREEEKAVEVI
ncbi:polysaccharide biosynthesis tyrosine autokinase [bacterium]|nr:polysaccharide biosynthesis tyrosine autokinase [bacterium]